MVVHHFAMSETERERDDRQDSGRTRKGGRDREDAVEAVASSTVRVLLGVLGILLLLFAIGQVVGVDAMAMLSDALATQEARWMLVALFAIVMIALAIRGFG